MAVRDAMEWIIAEVRRMVYDTAEAVWTDQQVQDTLDRYRIDANREKLNRDDEYKIYWLEYTHLESASLYEAEGKGGALVDSSTYTASLINCHFVFTSAVDKELYLTAVRYDVHACVVDLLMELMANPSKCYTWQRGSVRQTGYSLTDLINLYRGRSGAQSIRLNRVYG